MIGSAGNPGIFRTLHGSTRGLTGLFLLLGLLAPAGVEAQMEESDLTGGGFELFLNLGVVQPISNLTENPGSFGTVVTPNVSFGLDATVWTSKSFGIGVLGFYSPANLDAFATQFQGAIPEELGSVDYIAGLVNLTYRIRSSGSARALEPYFSIGGGVRHIRVEEIAGPEAVNATDPAATLAAGIRVLVSDGVWIRAELRDVASLYESPATGDSKLQNDIGISFGLGFSP